MTIKAGTIRTIVQEYVRHECSCCGEPATKRQAYLLLNARRNPASSGYGKDDISWCSDHEEFICDECKEPHVDGYEWVSGFSGERFPHMIHFFREISREDKEPIANGEVS